MLFDDSRLRLSAQAGRWALALTLMALATPAKPAGAKGGGWVCTHTAFVQRAACKREVSVDLLTAKAICLNLSDPDERAECSAEANGEAREARELCNEQLNARVDVCGAIGQAAYDPEFDPADFDTDFENLTTPNPFYPLTPGYEWTFEGGGETINLEILADTKNVEGVTCITLHDVVEDDGELVEDTFDWLAQHVDGDTWYCGEIALNYETFEGDDPEEPELVDIEGSWKHGRDGAKAGIWVPATLPVGTTYRQEWAAGDAEDIGRVVSLTYGFGNGSGLDGFVPQALADLLCNDDCMVTRDFSPIEPGDFELKYYAPGIGPFLEVKPGDGEIVQLVDCNFDARCALLPAP